ncbi:hypothetical protein [Metabacillus elymi]|uniref:Uncharacterized protein n=1 Tax=Metabacillus elymi TaxID=2745198 RepID=A0ABX6S352_9BACI|nr:hypothetical protein [Metabacillus sp. KUDC1714]QNF28529.1 hypothetical protein HUW50_14200 [Metabacillus sp. KUDC1714]
MNKLLSEFNDHVKQSNKNYTIGTITLLIYSTEIFKNNKDIIPFLDAVFNVSYLPYVIKSRTLICAKLARELYNKEENEIRIINKNLLNYFELNSQNETTNNVNKKKQKKNANEKLDSWLKGL